MFAPMSKPYNFYSGPAILPEEVLLQAQEAIHNFSGTGLSILEISHRSKEFVEVMDEAIALVKELMQLNADHEVMFLQGGGSMQFCMAPMNLLNENETACYLETGQWASYALTEAKHFGKVHIAASSKQDQYTYIPKQLDIPADTKYLHITSNNTIYGTQISGSFMDKLLSNNNPVVCDMSSDLFSRKLDYNRFGLIYAAAQKNFGPAGVTLVVVNKHLLGRVSRPLPAMLDYRTHIKKESMHNTPPCFALYVAMLALRWTKKQGLENIEKQNIRKAENLYAAIDNSAVFKGIAAKEDRSLMNVCFRSVDVATEEKFLSFCKQKNILGIKGYRTVGGFRASIYNAMPEQGVSALVSTIQEFEYSAAQNR